MRRAALLYRGDLLKSVCFECFVLSGIGLCEALTSCTQESYECLSVVSFVFSLVEFSPSGRSLDQRSPMEI